MSLCGLDMLILPGIYNNSGSGTPAHFHDLSSSREVELGYFFGKAPSNMGAENSVAAFEQHSHRVFCTFSIKVVPLDSDLAHHPLRVQFEGDLISLSSASQQQTRRWLLEALKV
ncbi:hypothetical protein M422DRAFT_269383 [Sphaerobolus stellatus SS14]|uniref:Uncharacterized protein n=1 Tax=Sphaerobolus stellatus (strain SS14) TaxID=990650 RepID=A0A0C9UVI0_SPHS4|nr:hypothetical protein M422DRAFT_269383 [Sphaerobolus stellatus SS14]